MNRVDAVCSSRRRLAHADDGDPLPAPVIPQSRLADKGNIVNGAGTCSSHNSGPGLVVTVSVMRGGAAFGYTDRLRGQL